jgi:hypothetical protein
VNVLILFLAAVVGVSMMGRERPTPWLLLAMCCATAAALMTHRFT